MTFVKQGTEDPVGKNLDNSPEAQPLAHIKDSTKEAIITVVLLYRDPPRNYPSFPGPWLGEDAVGAQSPYTPFFSQPSQE